MIQDKKLLEASLRGDASAFEQIVVQYQSLICAITLGATGRLDISEELSQETFLRAWKSLTQLKELDKFRAWLCAIARNVIQNYLRTKKRESVVISGSVELAESTPSDSISVPERLIRQEEETMMQTALMRIPQDYRDVLILFYRQQQSVEKVAEQLELTEDAVRTRLHRGRQMLRDEVAAMVERSLERTAPGKDFTKAVMVAIGGIIAGTAATSQAVATNGVASSTATATGASTLLTGVGIKIAAIAAVVVIGAGALVYYVNLSSKTEALKPAALDSRLRGNDKSQEQAQVKETAAAVNTAESKAEIPATKLLEAQPIAAAEKPQTISVLQDKVIEPNKLYEFKPRGVLSGLITDAETGKPVTDAEVRVCISRDYTAKTDLNGFYYFDKIDENGNYRLGIASDNYVGIEDLYMPPMVNLQKDRQVVQHFQLKKACKVEVRVINEDGRPIEKAVVRVTVLSSGGRAVVDNRPMKTDEKGKILRGGFPANDNYLITVTHCGPDIKVEGRKGMYREGKLDYAPVGLKVYLDKPGQTEYAEVVLEKGQSVRGYATYKDGQPADDVEISAQPDWWHSNYCPQLVAVEPNGFFTLEQIVPGNYRIQANIPAGGTMSTGYNLMECSLPPLNDELLQVKMPSASPKSMASIRGKVKFTGSQTPSYVEVQIYSGKSQYQQTYHIGRDAYGKIGEEFVLARLEPGTYTLQFSGDGIEEKTIQAQAPSDNLEVELIYVGKPKLSGTVVDSQTGQPIKEFQIRVKKLETLRGPTYWQNDQLTTFVNDNGTFEVEAVGPGVYQVQAQAEGYAPVWSEQIDTDRNVPVTIALTAGGASIKGVVVNENGQLVKDAKVVPFSLAGGTQLNTKDTFVSDKGAVVTNEKGEFVLIGLSAGRETLKVTHPEYVFTIIKDISVTVGQCTDNVKAILRVGGTVEGFVYDQDGNSQDGVVIYAADNYNYNGLSDEETGRLAMATSEPNGFYRIRGLPEQVCYLIRQNEWNATGIFRRTVLPKQGKVSRVDFGGKNILRGQIIFDAQPLSNQRIQLGQPSAEVFRARTMTDLEGRFTFKGIPAGRYRISFNKSEPPYAFVDIGTFQYDGSNVDLGIIPTGYVELTLALKQPQDVPWQISDVYIIDDKDDFFFQTRGQPSPSDVYVIKNIHPGVYSLMINRADGLLFKDSITIPDKDKKPVLEYTLPSNTASLYGTISETIHEVELVNQTKKVQKTIRKKEDSSYTVSQIPAGQYYLKLPGFAETGNSVPVYLSPGQQLLLNIDETQFEKHPLSQLEVTVVSENGDLMDGADVVLEKDGQTLKPEWAYGGGKYIFFSTTPGQYLLRVHCKGYVEIERKITLESIPADQRRYIEQNKAVIRLEPK